MKVKIFIAESASSAEYKINDFIEKEKIEVADIKITMSRVQMVCIVVYTPKESDK